jgi:MauM/NapG family ferredoxin protein
MIDLETSWYHHSMVLFLLGTILALWVWHRFTFRRGLQVFSMNLYIVLFWMASLQGRPDWPVNFFLFSDPLLALVHTLAGKVLIPLLVVSLVFIALAAVMGRVFCSHVCPLGTLLDISDHQIGRRQGTRQNRENYYRARKAKFAFLLVMLWAALFGINLLGLGDPMVIFTRFAATVFYPVVMLLFDLGLQVLRPVSDWAGWLEVTYFELTLPSFEGAIFMAALLALVLLLGRLQPRFWCRYICPLGALLGWAGRWAPYRRRVNDACNGCNVCTRECPSGAIHEMGVKTDRSECIVCHRCVHACPESAVSFSFQPKNPAMDLTGVEISRRAFFGGALGGLAVALAMRADILHPSEVFLPLPLRHQDLIRPPGALPEPAFLRRCARCGECMRACPTNTLQPDWYRAGLGGLWVPRMNLRHAACDQQCNVCGLVCPTESIRPLSLTERRHARVGIAVIVRDRCLPWAQNERCLVCEEQCPYRAITFRQDDRYQFGLPVVRADRCNGCGRCEDKCPVKGNSAIVVMPHGELRLSRGSYIKECRTRGLVFEEKVEGQNEFLLDDGRVSQEVLKALEQLLDDQLIRP